MHPRIKQSTHYTVTGLGLVCNWHKQHWHETVTHRTEKWNKEYTGNDSTETSTLPASSARAQGLRPEEWSCPAAQPEPTGPHPHHRLYLKTNHNTVHQESPQCHTEWEHLLSKAKPVSLNAAQQGYQMNGERGHQMDVRWGHQIDGWPLQLHARLHASPQISFESNSHSV